MLAQIIATIALTLGIIVGLVFAFLSMLAPGMASRPTTTREDRNAIIGMIGGIVLAIACIVGIVYVW